MFTTTCSHCDSRVLLDTSRIEAVVNHPAGIVVRYRCWCGADGTWSPGVHPPAATPVPVAA